MNATEHDDARAWLTAHLKQAEDSMCSLATDLDRAKVAAKRADVERARVLVRDHSDWELSIVTDASDAAEREVERLRSALRDASKLVRFIREKLAYMPKGYRV